MHIKITALLLMLTVSIGILFPKAVYAQEIDPQDERDRDIPRRGSIIVRPQDQDAQTILLQEDTQPQYDVDAIEHELLVLVNELRDNKAVDALEISSKLEKGAGIRAGEAVYSFSHTRPDGKNFNTVFADVKIELNGKRYGEGLVQFKTANRSYDEAEIAAKLFETWLGSPKHYSNLIRKSFAYTGIRVKVSDIGDRVKFTAAQLFTS